MDSESGPAHPAFSDQPTDEQVLKLLRSEIGRAMWQLEKLMDRGRDLDDLLRKNHADLEAFIANRTEDDERVG